MTKKKAAAPKETVENEVADQNKEAAKSEIKNDEVITGSDRKVLEVIGNLKKEFALRHKGLLTGMANSTAEVIRCLGDAETHLADHISQTNKIKGE